MLVKSCLPRLIIHIKAPSYPVINKPKSISTSSFLPFLPSIRITVTKCNDVQVREFPIGRTITIEIFQMTMFL